MFLIVGMIVAIEILVLLFIEVWRGRKDSGISMLTLTAVVLPLIFFVLSKIMHEH